jgi:hypothetical protein
MANINLYRVSVPPGQYSKVDWTECDINPGPTQYLYDRFTSIDFQAVNNTVSASSAATIAIIGYCLDDCTGCYLIGETTTTSTTIPPPNFTISTTCEGSGVNGTGNITIGSFSGGNGTYTSVGIGTSAGQAFSATPTLLSGATSYSYTNLTNGTYHVILRDSSGANTTKNITVSCNNTTTTTTSTTSTTTAAPICTFNGGSATVVYPITSTTTSTTTTEGPTTTSTSTSTTTTEPPTTTTTTTSAGYSWLFHGGGTGYSTSAAALASFSGGPTRYSNSNAMIGGVTTFYTDTGLSTTFNGGDLWYRVQLNGAGTNYAAFINSSGLVTTYTS